MPLRIFLFLLFLNGCAAETTKSQQRGLPYVINVKLDQIEFDLNSAYGEPADRCELLRNGVEVAKVGIKNADLTKNRALGYLISGNAKRGDVLALSSCQSSPPVERLVRVQTSQSECRTDGECVSVALSDDDCCGSGSTNIKFQKLFAEPVDCAHMDYTCSKMVFKCVKGKCTQRNGSDH